MQQVDGASDWLRSYVLARLAQKEQGMENCAVEEVLQQAVAEGHRHLAEEASELLATLGSRVGGTASPPDAKVGQPRWDEQVQAGRGVIEVLGQEWEYLDYKDALPLDD